MTFATVIIAFLAGVMLGIAGGAASSWKLAGKDLGESFAALIGGFFGLVHAIPATILGILILYFIG